jgi:hypothetical protein
VGDSIYLDINGDGKITDLDKVKKITAPAVHNTANISLVLGTDG